MHPSPRKLQSPIELGSSPGSTSSWLPLSPLSMFKSRRPLSQPKPRGGRIPSVSLRFPTCEMGSVLGPPPPPELTYGDDPIHCPNRRSSAHAALRWPLARSGLQGLWGSCRDSSVDASLSLHSGHRPCQPSGASAAHAMVTTKCLSLGPG